MMTFTILVVLIAMLLTGIPIFAGLALTSLAITILSEGSISSVADTVFAKLDNGLLTAIPMFAFMAHVMIRSKVVDDLYDAANAMVGHLKGGLGVATVLACTIFAAISGSSVATALTIGSSAIPQMKRFGYRPSDTYGVIAAGGTLGILIPPSGPLILYAIVSETSIGALFIAGLIPGIMMALLFAIYCMAQGYLRKEIEDIDWIGWKSCLGAMRKSFWSLIMPPLVLGGIYLGVFTASEAAAIGSIYALFVGSVVYKNFGIRDLAITAYDTVRTTSMLFMILAAAAMFGHAVTIIRLPIQLMESVTSMGLGPMQFILMIMLVIFILGMFLETIAIILITTPIILPALMAFDVNLVWYGILLMINLELALITPPVGMNLFVIKGIAKAPLADVIRGAMPYVILMLIGLVLVLIFEPLALWLPRLAGFGN
ncbi:TRAP transporter large permease [Cohaesibacter celericrescens]|uniref:TRAP transporter large permease protein n=1 Tax=Cohaesibacter celericrescens TaxID=2067669 RepID=A0A2N5XXI2_9HYPH|nr:TRAP transporter large permease [Cohaesibacter celericrescens]PLW79200.1 C4-dicarboxylate ABC transporter [Cohaesibacter celericrescens]